MDLWIRIRFTRAQLIIGVISIVALIAILYALFNYTAIRAIFERRNALDALQNCRAMLTKVQASSRVGQELLENVQSQISQAEQALHDNQFPKSITFAQTCIATLEEELHWIEIDQKGRSAKFERLVGSVQVRKPGKDDWETANLDMVIEEESEIRTGRDGEAKIRFDNGAASELTPDSLLIVRRLGVDTLNRIFQNDIGLQQGGIDYENRRPSDITQIDLDKGGSFSGEGPVKVHAEKGEGTRPSLIEVTEGQGQFSDLHGNLVTLAPMMRVQVSSEGHAGAARAILPSPDLIAPPMASSLRFSSLADISVLFRWSNLDKASGYLLEVAEDSRFEKILESRKVKTSTTEIKAFSEGVYWWRVRAIDQDGTLYEPSNYRSFRVMLSGDNLDDSRDGPEVKFERVKMISRTSVLVEGHTSFGVQLYINDQSIAVDLSGKFKDFIVLKTQGKSTVQVEAIDPDGRRTSFPLEVNKGPPS